MAKTFVISDLHLGEKDSFFTMNDGLLDDLAATVQSLGSVDEVIIVGDLLEFSFARSHETYDRARVFFEKIAPLPAKIVYIPGNHDHHPWFQLVENVEIVERIRNGATPQASLQFVGRSFPGPNGENPPFLKGLLPEDMQDKLTVTYPNYYRKIGNVHYMFHHGHFLENIHTVVSELMGSSDLNELEALNLPQYELGWYLLGQASKRISGRIELVYKASEILGTLLRSKKDSNMRGKVLDEKLLDEIKSYISNYLIAGRYQVPREACPFTFVFGHTHVAAQDEVEIDGQVYPVFNTGGWVRGVEGGADYLVIDDSGPRQEKMPTS